MAWRIGIKSSASRSVLWATISTKGKTCSGRLTSRTSRGSSSATSKSAWHRARSTSLHGISRQRPPTQTITTCWNSARLSANFCKKLRSMKSLLKQASTLSCRVYGREICHSKTTEPLERARLSSRCRWWTSKTQERAANSTGPKPSPAKRRLSVADQ